MTTETGVYRNPAIHWFFIMLTAGLYAFWWGFRMLHEVNVLAGGAALNVGAHARTFGIGLGIYIIAGFGSMLYHGPWPSEGVVYYLLGAFMVLAVGLSFHFIWVLITVARMLRSLSGQRTPRSGVVLLLYCILALALPYLQDHLNIHLARIERLGAGQAGARAAS